MLLQQFENQADPAIDEATTGPEIRDGASGAIDILVLGVGAGFVPGELDLSLLVAVEHVSNEEAIQFTRRLAREEGTVSGISCGAAEAVAARLAQHPEHAGRTFVVVLPDSGESHLSSALLEDVFDAAGLPEMLPAPVAQAA